ncbi:MAG: DNA N-6-adenine-methyltransferase [Candidatus Omnitrophota bacterium]|nr:DNA N-6-adenine-methyltransferase [Candidatus Omnitrophota bacterium]
MVAQPPMPAGQYQLLPSLSDEDYQALREDVRLRGVQVPIELDEAGNILDGHHRARIAQELGLTCPTLIRHGLTHQQKMHHVLSLNLHRRHLTREQRVELERRLRDEGMTYTQIAEAVKVDPATVQRDTSTIANAKVEPDAEPDDAQPEDALPSLFSAPTPPEPQRIVGRDGKARPAKYKQRKPTFGHTQKQAQKKARDQIILSSESHEWYTPARYVEAAREVLGHFDVDPASSEQANQTVLAARFYTEADNGLAFDWPGKVWMNPPYGQLVGAFVGRLVQQFRDGIVTEAIVLVNAHSTDTAWFQPLWDHTLCFTDHRINFEAPDGVGGGSTHGNVFIYLGPEPLNFRTAFQQFGAVVQKL